MTYKTGLRAIAVGVTASATLLGAAGVTSAADLNAVEKKLAALAKAEGEVTIINPIFQDLTAQRLQESFIKRYDLGPNFKFNNLRKGTGAVVSQVRQEILANKFSVDTILVNHPGFFDEASKRGAFLQFESGYWESHYAENIKKAGQYANYPYVVTPLYYTFQPVWNSACPGMKDFTVTSYADVIKPEMKGKTIASDLTKSLTYTNTVIALLESGWDANKFWADLKATEPLIEFRTEAKMQLVVSCERPLDQWNITGRVFQNVQKKPELAKDLKFGYYKEGQVALGNQLAILKGAQHPNAAKLLVEYMLSEEGTNIYVAEEALQSFRKDYKPPASIAQFLTDFDGNKVPIIGIKDWVAAAKKYNEVRGEWQKMFR